MKIILQRVKEAKVIVDGQVIGEIQKGILAFIGFCKEDINHTEDFFRKIIHKILQLRIFEDENQKMNQSLLDIKGQILIVSQFTLCGDPYKGNRPSFTEALEPNLAEKLYNDFINLLYKEFRKKFLEKYPTNEFKDNFIQQGKFKAMMDIFLINDGPVTFYLEYN